MSRESGDNQTNPNPQEKANFSGILGKLYEVDLAATDSVICFSQYL